LTEKIVYNYCKHIGMSNYKLSDNEMLRIWKETVVSDFKALFLEKLS
jgi:hypothetical protein